MKDHPYLLYGALTSVLLQGYIFAGAQSIAGNPWIMEHRSGSQPVAIARFGDSRFAAQELSRLRPNAQQLAAMDLGNLPPIQLGDVMVFATTRRDFVLTTHLSNGRTIISRPIGAEDATETAPVWRGSRISLDEAAGQKILRFSVRVLHDTSVPMLFRDLKIYRQSKVLCELLPLAPVQEKAPELEPPARYAPDPVVVASLTRPSLSLGPSTPPTGYVTGMLPVFRPIMFQSTASSPSPNHFKWNGKEFDDESGLYNFGARHYSPSLGRFVSPDPKMITKQKMFDPQQWNMYSYARNNPTTFTDPNGQEVRLAEGLSRSDQNRIIHNLAAAYRKETGRAAINGLAKSDITYTYRTGHLPDRVVTGNGHQYVEQKFGETVPYLKGTKDQTTAQYDSVERTRSHVEVTFDFGKLGAASSAFLNGQRQEPPPTEQHVNDHEMGHQVDVDKDPLKEHNQSTEQAEKNADSFANALAHEKNTMSQKDAEKQVRGLLKDPN